MANYINKYLNQSAYDADSTKQYPNTSLVGTDVVFAATQPTPANEWDVMWQVTITNNNSQEEGAGFPLWAYGPEGPLDPADNLDEIKVDDVAVSLNELYSEENTYYLTNGTHTVKYKVKTVQSGETTPDAATNLGWWAFVYDVLVDMGDGEITRFEANNGFTEFDPSVIATSSQLKATNVVLPSTLSYITYEYTLRTMPIECTNLTLKNSTETVEFDAIVQATCDESSEQDIWYDKTTNEWVYCTDVDENEVCISTSVATNCIEDTIASFPTYSNLYVPSSMVTEYETAGWENVNALQS